jgi:phosphomannomutase
MFSPMALPTSPSPTPHSPSDAPHVYAFGTSGYRDNTDAGFGDTVITQLGHAIADALIEQANSRQTLRPVLLGGDTRDKTKAALPILRQVLFERGLDVMEVQGDVATPILAYAAAHFGKIRPDVGACAGAILLTASHNPWDYGGINFLTPDGAVAPATITKRFEYFQANPNLKPANRKALHASTPTPVHSWFDPMPAYTEHLRSLNLLPASLGQSGLHVVYDPLYATGRKVFPRLLAEAGLTCEVLHDTDERPNDPTLMPEPGPEQLEELAARVRTLAQAGHNVVGLSNDGDSDRFGVVDETGRFLHPNEVLALLLYELTEHRHMNGVVVRSQATTHWLDAYARQHGMATVATPVGYKYIAETFLEEDNVVLGGESSGGLSISQHIPEKDGLLANLLLLNLLAREGKPLSQLVPDVLAKVNRAFSFRELTIVTEAKQAILDQAKVWYAEGGQLLDGELTFDTKTSHLAAEALKARFGTQDGVKLWFANQQGWLLVRTSGTEPLVRLYFEVQADTPAEAEALRAKLTAWATGWLQTTFGIDPAHITLKA